MREMLVDIVLRDVDFTKLLQIRSTSSQKSRVFKFPVRTTFFYSPLGDFLIDFLR
jgi:hypothetical protein